MIDETDKKILKILQEKGRTPFLEISKQLRIAESTVRKRVRDMENSGTIKKYAAVIDSVSLGKVAFVGVDVKSEHFLDVAKKLASYEQVKFVATCTGDHTIMAKIEIEDTQKLRTFLSEKVEAMPGVTRICPAIVTDTVKC